MSSHVVNFLDDLPSIRRYFVDRVRAQSVIGKQVTGIEVGFQLNQAGLLILHFETKAAYRPQGNYTLALDKYALDLEHWGNAYDSAYESGISFVLLDGQRVTVDPEAGDLAVASVFGEAIRAVVSDTFARGTFAPLTLSRNCQIIFEEFDAMWSWAPSSEGTDDRYPLSAFPAVLLPS